MQFGVLHISIDCHHQIPISPSSHQIFLFQFAIYLVGPRLSEGGHVLRVCLTSLGCVVAIYVVLVLAVGHSLVVIPEMDEEVCEILAFWEGFCCTRCYVEDDQCYLLCSISVYRVFSSNSLVTVFPKVMVRNSKGWGECSLNQSTLLYSKVCLVFLCGYFRTRQGHNPQLVQIQVLQQRFIKCQMRYPS